VTILLFRFSSYQLKRNGVTLI